jgi:tetratricopeptide (TPR) repeat protein
MVLCLEAMAIDPGRHNAHKNLGIALEGLGRYAEAAQSYGMAARLCPQDRRAHDLLEKLKRARPLVAVGAAMSI